MFFCFNRKIHESGQERKRMPVYWMVVPPTCRPNAASCDKDSDREIWDGMPEVVLEKGAMHKESASCEGEPARPAVTQADCSELQEEQKQKCTESQRGMETLAEEGNEAEGGKSVKGEEEGDYEAEYSDVEDTRDNDEAFTEEDDEDDECSNEKGAEEHESAEELKIKKVNKSGVNKKSTYVIRCNKCNEQFVSRKKYVDHCRDIHQCLPGKVYQCDICSKSFASYNSWKEHRACVHTDERQFACSLCNATFKRKRDVRTHYVRKHEGERLFKCDVCGKHFATNEYLKCHKRCHMGAKPYKCEVCGKTFGLRASLAQHSNRIHTGEKPYKCRACERTFTDMSTLRRHMRHKREWF
uniref:C2H2-type domain-containing protein n=1 Tax=Phasianus colchicus TaxID=9054 RepID=A0A669Q4V1_PHACC